MVAETTRKSAATPRPAIKTPTATIQRQRGLRFSITRRKFSGGSGNGPVLTVYAIDFILPLSFNQPVGPWFHLHASSDIFSYFGALSAYAKLRFSYRSFVVLRKSTVWLNRAVNC